MQINEAPKEKTMHAKQLAELGCWVATNAGSLIYGEADQTMLSSTNYWTASRVRLNRWGTALKMFEEDFEDPSSGHNPWPALSIVAPEILMSEMLTRIWASVVASHDWYRQSDEMHGLAHSIHIGHIEAKNRAFRVMLKGQDLNQEAFDQQNALRRRLERWTDLFLGQLPSASIAAKFAFDRKRVVDFNEEQIGSIGSEQTIRQKVLTASFATDLLRDDTEFGANPELNRQIAAGILTCFQSDRFDSFGLPKSVRSIWVEKSQFDTQMLVDRLVDFEKQAETVPTKSDSHVWSRN